MVFVFSRFMQILVRSIIHFVIKWTEIAYWCKISGLEQGLYNTVNIGFGFGWCFPFRPGGNYDYVLIFSALYMIGSLWIMQQVVYTFAWYIQFESSLKWYLFGKYTTDRFIYFHCQILWALDFIDHRNGKLPAREYTHKNSEAYLWKLFIVDCSD